MEDIIKKQLGETDFDYKARLYRNRSIYNLSWQEVGKLLGKEQNADHIRKTSYGYLEAIKDENNIKFDKSVMIINDIHLPHEREDVLDIISKHSNEITHLVIAGDLMDCESISSFPNIKQMTLKDEIIYAYEFMKKVRKILNNKQQILICNGNHEERMCTTIKKLHEKDLQQFINPNVIDMLVEGFTIYENDKKLKYAPIEGITYIPHWYINIDDKIIVSHPKDFSSVNGKMCEKVAEHFLNKHMKFDVLVFGHTHKFSTLKVTRRQDAFVIENGCLCKNHDYADCGKLSYNNQCYCYTIIKYNNDEKININNIKTYHLEELETKYDNYKVSI